MPLRKPVDLERFAAQNTHDRFPLPACAPAMVSGQWSGQGGSYVLVFLGRHVCAWWGVIGVIFNAQACLLLIADILSCARLILAIFHSETSFEKLFVSNPEMRLF